MAVKTLLLIQEMKRAIEIMEAKPELKRTHLVTEGSYQYPVTDREIVELRNLFNMIRRHTVIVEKEEIKW
ncbi:hypothetical protein [Paenibacillus sp. MMO-177]|uniref:hypothetical protein n=1 Tax=Paenibacillus sp. MMO-177 TaxID=3081289 RepID=UPI003019DF85